MRQSDAIRGISKGSLEVVLGQCGDQLYKAEDYELASLCRGIFILLYNRQDHMEELEAAHKAILAQAIRVKKAQGTLKVGEEDAWREFARDGYASFYPEEMF